ncbi:MAG: hypothetical protein ACFFCW_19840 [Candidatus Hodarchaeota archaeon]
MRKLVCICLMGLLLMASGCASLRSSMGKLGELDLANAEVTRQLATDWLTTWRLNSGFIRGALGSAGLEKLPYEAVKAMDELDEMSLKLVKKIYYTTPEEMEAIISEQIQAGFRLYREQGGYLLFVLNDTDDMDLGKSLGNRVRMLGAIVIEALEQFCPDVLPAVLKGLTG